VIRRIGIFGRVFTSFGFLIVTNNNMIAMAIPTITHIAIMAIIANVIADRFTWLSGQLIQFIQRVFRGAKQQTPPSFVFVV
jgi:hypothetical protein